MKKLSLMVIMSMAFVSVSMAVDMESAALELLADAGAKSYAADTSYGRGLDAMYIGYNESGKAIAAVAARSTKTYKKVLTMATVKPGDSGYAISKTEVPDIKKLPGKSRQYVTEALEDIAGRQFSGADDTRALVDGVSGATKYYKAIYISYSLMAKNAIGELEANPDWPRQPLP